MTGKVAGASKDVNPDGGNVGCHPVYSAAVRTLRDRIDWILRSQKISERELARRAGLAPPQVGLLLKRLAQKDHEGVTLRTLTALAQGAGVSLAWLAAGVGPEAASAEHSPTRAAAAQMAEREGVWPEAIRSVLAEEPGEGQAARTAAWWLLRIKQRELEMIDEAKRRDAELTERHPREHATIPPITAPARSGRRQKRVALAETDPASGAETTEAKPPKKG